MRSDRPDLRGVLRACSSALVKKIILPLLLAVFLIGTDSANAAPPGVERAESRQSRRSVQDDRRDRDELASYVAAWKEAVATRNRLKESVVDGKIDAWIQRELAEERRENRQSSRERNRSRRELKRTQSVRGVSPGTRKDRYDLNDDRRDAQRQRGETQRLSAIAARLAKMQPRFSAGTATKADYAEKKKLLEALLAAEAREVKTSKKERNEDRRERREFR